MYLLWSSIWSCKFMFKTLEYGRLKRHFNMFLNKSAMAMAVLRILNYLDSVYHVHLLMCKSSVHCASIGHVCLEDTRMCFKACTWVLLERCWDLYYLFSNDKITLCFCFNSIWYCIVSENWQKIITSLCKAQPMNMSQLWTN